jgi:hypothetical protein
VHVTEGEGRRLCPKYLLADKRDCVVFLAPARVTADLDTLWLEARSQIRKVLGHLALGQWCRNEDSANAFTLRVNQAVDDERLDSI